MRPFLLYLLPRRRIRDVLEIAILKYKNLVPCNMYIGASKRALRLLRDDRSATVLLRSSLLLSSTPDDHYNNIISYHYKIRRFIMRQGRLFLHILLNTAVIVNIYCVRVCVRELQEM